MRICMQDHEAHVSSFQAQRITKDLLSILFFIVLQYFLGRVVPAELVSAWPQGFPVVNVCR